MVVSMVCVKEGDQQLKGERTITAFPDLGRFGKLLMGCICLCLVHNFPLLQFARMLADSQAALQPNMTVILKLLEHPLQLCFFPQTIISACHLHLTHNLALRMGEGNAELHMSTPMYTFCCLKIKLS